MRRSTDSSCSGSCCSAPAWPRRRCAIRSRPPASERRIVVPRGARCAAPHRRGELARRALWFSTRRPRVRWCSTAHWDAAPCPGPDAAAVRQQAITSELQLAVWRGGRTAAWAPWSAGSSRRACSRSASWAWHDADAPRRWDAPRVIGLTAVVGLGTGLGALIGHHAGRWTPLTLGHTGP